MDDLVVVEAVPTVTEAGIVCGLLREVVVRGEDADKARKVLAEQRA